MATGLAAFNLIAIGLLIACSASSAGPPLAMAELESQRAIAQADWDQAKAKQDLAAWKLTRLKPLQVNGHVSWQEVGQQQVAVRSFAAHARAVQQYFRAVVDWQERLTNAQSNQHFTDFECVRLYMPRTSRLDFGWMSTDVASVQMAKQHLESLGREH